MQVISAEVMTFVAFLTGPLVLAFEYMLRPVDRLSNVRSSIPKPFSFLGPISPMHTCAVRNFTR